MTIKGKVEYIDKIVEELEEEGIKLSKSHTSSSPPEDFLDLYVHSKEVCRYCHHHDNPDLMAHLPSHRKHFIKKCKEVLQ